MSDYMRKKPKGILGGAVALLLTLGAVIVSSLGGSPASAEVLWDDELFSIEQECDTLSSDTVITVTAKDANYPLTWNGDLLPLGANVFYLPQGESALLVEVVVDGTWVLGGLTCETPETTTTTTTTTTVAETTTTTDPPAPTTVAPTTDPPTTVAPTTVVPTTDPPTTVAPTTVAPKPKAPSGGLPATL